MTSMAVTTSKLPRISASESAETIGTPMARASSAMAPSSNPTASAGVAVADVAHEPAVAAPEVQPPDVAQRSEQIRDDLSDATPLITANGALGV